VWKCKSLNGEEMWLCVLELVVFRFFVGVFENKCIDWFGAKGTND